MMDARDSRGRTVSLLCEDLPRLSQLNLPRASPQKPPSLSHHHYNSFSSSSTTTTNEISRSPTTSNTPPLARSDSGDSRAYSSSISPTTPQSAGFDCLRQLPQLHLHSKPRSNIEGLPGIASISEPRRRSSAHSPMDWPQTPQGSDFAFPSSASQNLFDPTADAGLQPSTATIPTPTSAVFDHHLAQAQAQQQPPSTQQAYYPATVNTQKSTQKKNSYPCPVSVKYSCNEFFTTSGHAARHAKKHTGKKDAICPECTKAFTRKDNMEQHRRTHAGGRGITTSRSDPAAADEPSSSMPSASKLLPREVTEESKARKARHNQRKARPSSISTAAPIPQQPMLPPSAPGSATTAVAPGPALELLDPALRADNNAALFPGNDFAASFPYPSVPGQHQQQQQHHHHHHLLNQQFSAPHAPMRRPSLSRSSHMSSLHGQTRDSPPSRSMHYPNPDPLSPSLAPALDALALAASRQ